MRSGGKRVAVKSLMALPSTTLDVLLNDINMLGPEKTAFTDEAFSNKKILPGSQWPSPKGLKHLFKVRSVLTTLFLFGLAFQAKLNFCF